VILLSVKIFKAVQTTTYTNANGIYTSLVPNGQYKIVPPSISGYGLNPISRSIIVSGSDICNQDFFVFGWESIHVNN